MNGNTEPLIAVIGHPIAGNPTQFAIECALKSLELDYRVLSFDVPAENLAAAINGLEVLGFRGVLVDQTLASDVAQWWQEKTENETIGAPIHCLFRDPDSQMSLTPHNAKYDFLVKACDLHIQSRDVAIEDVLWLGARDEFFPIEPPEGKEMALFTRTPPIESVQQASLIVLAPGPKNDVRLEASEWPADDGSTLVIDLTDDHDELMDVDAKGYTTLSRRSVQTGIIQESLVRWSGQEAIASVINEAIEEYLGV